MKKVYNEVEVQITKFTKLEDVLAASGVVWESESDGDTTTIPEFWV